MADNHKAQWVFLMGNLSEGFEVFGPYPDFDTLCEAHDCEAGWGMQLLPPCKPHAPIPDGH